MSRNSTLYIGVGEHYLDFVPSYKKYVAYFKEWVTGLCQQNFEEVLFGSENVADDLLTIKDNNITVDIMIDMLNLNIKSFSKAGMFYPFETSNVYIFGKNPIKVHKDAFHNFLPINGNVYLILMTLMTLASGILALTKYPVKDIGKFIQLQYSEFVNMAAVLLRQGEITSRKSLPYKVLFGSWLVGAFLLSVMTQTYLKCQFVSVEYKPMETVADVTSNLDVVSPFVFEDTYIETYLKTSPDPNARYLWKYLNNTGKFLNVNSIGEGIDRVQNAEHFAIFVSKTALILLGTDLLGLVEKDTLYHGIPLFTANVGPLHSSKLSSTCKEYINRKLIKMQEIKMVEGEQKEIIYDLDAYKFEPTLDEEEFVLSWAEFKSLLVIMTFGLMMSLAHFIAQAIWWYRKWLHKQNHTKVRRFRLRHPNSY